MTPAWTSFPIEEKIVVQFDTRNMGEAMETLIVEVDQYKKAEFTSTRLVNQKSMSCYQTVTANMEAVTSIGGDTSVQ